MVLPYSNSFCKWVFCYEKEQPVTRKHSHFYRFAFVKEPCTAYLKITWIDCSVYWTQLIAFLWLFWRRLEVLSKINICALCTILLYAACHVIASLKQLLNIYHKCALNETLLFVLNYCRSHGSAMGIATGYRLDDWGVGVRVPVEPRIFTSPYYPDRLWGPDNLLQIYQ
jgi:hypothetical protein